MAIGRKRDTASSSRIFPNWSYALFYTICAHKIVSMPVSPARASAFEILLRIERTDAYAPELLHSSRFHSLSSVDHGLLTELVMGVLRWRGVLDEHISKHLNQPLTRLDLEVLSALRLGAYQLLFLDRVATHAAVNESVELVKQARKRSATGMMNAVLRKIANDSRRLSAEIPQFSQNQRDVVHPRSEYVAAHPQWLVERWEQIYGTEMAAQICAYDQREPKTAIRADHPHILEELWGEGIGLEPGTLLSKARIVTTGNITSTKAFRERRLIIQDEASQLVALLVGNGNAILDCCAAPGGKTRILAERNPRSTIIAIELHPHRAALLRKLVLSGNVHVVAGDVRQMPLAARFDRVLVDAPCSGTGTLARNPEIKWRLKLEDLRRLQQYQLEILLAAMDLVTDGGRLVYSTCSLEQEENSQVVQKALAAKPGFRILNCRDELMRLREGHGLVIENIESLLSDVYLRTVPGVHDCDGFFAALLEKS